MERREYNTNGTAVTGRRLLYAGLAFVSLLSLTGVGCSHMSASLAEQAALYGDDRRFTLSGEAPYYLEPAPYQQKQLMADYTAGLRILGWEKAEGVPDWEKTDGSSDPEETDWLVCSDECVSSSLELDQVLTQAMEKAALGVRLSFDRANYQPQEEMLFRWFSDFLSEQILESLCLDHVVLQTKETGSKCTVYLSLYYDMGRLEVLSLREETAKEADRIVRELREQVQAAGAGKESAASLADAVWDRMTKTVRYPGELQEAEPDEAKILPNWLRADGALLEQTACGQGMAAAGKLLLDRMEIENELLTEDGDQAGAHLFYNRLHLEDGWYRMNLCFGAAAGSNRDFYQKEAEYDGNK